MLPCTSRLWLLSFLLGLAKAALLNRTIDDQEGDSVTGAQPVYMAFNGSSWNYGPTCVDCYVKPDASECFDNGWHDESVFAPTPSSELPYVNLTFVGTAIYVFAVVPNTVPSAVTTTNLTFTLNDNLVATYYHNPNSSLDYEYDVPVYVNESMPNEQYTLQVQLQAGTSGSYFAFDYAIYTFDDTPTSSSGTGTSTSASSQTESATFSSAVSTGSQTPVAAFTKSSSHTGAIVGGVVGGLAGIAALLLVAFFLRRRGAGPRIPDFNGADIEGVKIAPFRPEMAQGAFAAQPMLINAPWDSSTDSFVGERAAAGPRVVPASALSPKAAERQQELARRVREMEQTVASLNARRAQASAAAPSSVEQSADRSVDDALRAQVDTLQVEVDRLRAAQEHAMTEPPPAY